MLPVWLQYICHVLCIKQAVPKYSLISCIDSTFYFLPTMCQASSQLETLLIPKDSEIPKFQVQTNILIHSTFWNFCFYGDCEELN